MNKKLERVKEIDMAFITFHDKNDPGCYICVNGDNWVCAAHYLKTFITGKIKKINKPLRRFFLHVKNYVKKYVKKSLQI